MPELAGLELGIPTNPGRDNSSGWNQDNKVNGIEKPLRGVSVRRLAVFSNRRKEFLSWGWHRGRKGQGCQELECSHRLGKADTSSSSLVSLEPQSCCRAGWPLPGSLEPAECGASPGSAQGQQGDTAAWSAGASRKSQLQLLCPAPSLFLSNAQISNYAGVRHSSMRYYSAAKNVTCRNCHRPGHLSKNCPTPKKVPPCCLCAGRDHLQHSCPARFCLNCCLPGHYFRECLERAYWNKHCNRCDMKGHYADACPEIWRQYHLTTKPGPIKAASSHSERSVSVYCYNCSRKGHLGFECSERRMQGNMFPTSPFVYYYDDECDIRRRASRLQRKVADLQEAGLLPEQSETALQEEQPEVPSHKKKSKLWKEQQGKQSKNTVQQKKMKMSQTKKAQERKHKRGVEIHCEPEDFPRGCKQQGLKGNKVHKSLFQAFSGSKAMCVQQHLEGAKRKKKWKKQKNASPDSKDNLLLIKQRRKKSKQKSW
ncbi:hypothetical protein IHE44_0011028 [Lamprotornis superbus]|uniref:Zinc finger CCHC domain-containing protein 7 n=1 Tax=Lamprotornis superbus TaxID=245042 RepID=A0A835TQ60_9PASS|nr:hypothetical protein IHE44_0011028 [Lamprotornis superbus]